jgi:Asp-tRNAAsn/Glu-tRNAGln amidotransferase C subunit
MKSEFTNEMVDVYADKILVGLTRDENVMVVDEFGEIDAHINMLNNIPNLSEVTPMTHCLDDFVYELREDEAEVSIPIDSLLKNCDDYIDAEVKVPKVVG